LLVRMNNSASGLNLKEGTRTDTGSLGINEKVRNPKQRYAPRLAIPDHSEAIYPGQRGSKKSEKRQKRSPWGIPGVHGSPALLTDSQPCMREPTRKTMVVWGGKMGY